MALNAESDELVTVVQLFRHDSRNPVKVFNNSLLTNAYDRPDQFGELTKEGKQEIYNLGAATRKRYKSILGPKYSKKYFKISSTGTDRTLMSAQLFAAGVYPTTPDEIWNNSIDWHPIPVYEVPTNVLAVYPKDHMVPSYRKEMREADFQMVEKLNETGLIDYISKNIGENITDAMSLAQIADAFMLAEEQGVELADWVHKIYPEPLKKIYPQYLRMLTNTTFRKQMYMGGFFYEIVEHLENKASNRSSGPNLLAYSAHDSSVVSFLEAVEVYDYQWPQCGSIITIELWKKGGEYIVEILYSVTPVAEPISIKLPRNECKLSDLKNIFKKFMTSREERVQYLSQTVLRT